MPRKKNGQKGERAAARKCTAQEIREQIDRAEVLLVQLSTVENAIRVLCRDFDITRAQAEERIKRVRERWDEESERAGNRERQRSAILQSVHDVYRRAMGARKIVRDHKGDPVLAPNAKGEMVPVYEADPDLRTGLRSLETKARILGLTRGDDNDKDRTIGDLAAAIRASKGAPDFPEDS